MSVAIDDRTEWLEADGLGGFASGTTSGIRTRRYHAVLLTATTPPTGRVVLVNGFELWADTPAGSFALSTQRYAPDVLHPDGVRHVAAFTADPWPTWQFALPDGSRLTQELVVQHGTGATVLAWRLNAGSPLTLRLRPLMSGRDYHSMHHENGSFNFDAEQAGGAVAFRPYHGLPRIVALSNGEYHHAPDWYRQFRYAAERERGLDDVEDLASPGEFRWHLSVERDAVLMLKTAANSPDAVEFRDAASVERLVSVARDGERQRRAAFLSPLDRAADAYLVQRRSGRTIVAGYPWFTDWGRDTFIALRGLCLATDRLADARDILVEWADAVSEGMLPNRFPDAGEQPEFNSVDASLWYVIAVDEFLERAAAVVDVVSPSQVERLVDATSAIVDGYARGTRFGIRMDDDGLLAAGVPGVQLTWMDARVGDRVITPRIGKPVEIQALWINALRILAQRDRRWQAALDRAMDAFAQRFWNADAGCLFDVVDVDHVRGVNDGTVRPNQILAAGGLPIALLDGARAKSVVATVERLLLTPIGLRSLAPGTAGYAARYEGGPGERDAIYHQGTVWPWLLGPFVDAWVCVRGSNAESRREARERFVTPLLAHLQEAGVGHVSEIADAESPFTPRGCPFQAWSLGELIRMDRVVLAEQSSPRLVTREQRRYA